MTGGRLILIVSSKGIILATAAATLAALCISPLQRSTGCLLALFTSSVANVKGAAELSEHAALQHDAPPYGPSYASKPATAVLCSRRSTACVRQRCQRRDWNVIYRMYLEGSKQSLSPRLSLESMRGGLRGRWRRQSKKEARNKEA